MSTSLAELSVEIARDIYPHASTTSHISLSWQDPEDFVKDLKMDTYTKNRACNVTDLSGAKIRWAHLEKEIQKEKDKVFASRITPEGSNANWGRITQPHEIQGTSLRDLEITVSDCKPVRTEIEQKFLPLNTAILGEKTETILKEGELTAPLYKSLEEQKKVQDNKNPNATTYMRSYSCKMCNSSIHVMCEGVPFPKNYDVLFCDDCKDEEILLCKGCNKYFATKASLKRHHERKKSCKDICEKAVDLSGTVLEVPDKPYIVDWVEQMLNKSISGDSDNKPYCKHCDVEFANKSNLNKHLSKSVACDKLAKQEFIKLLTNKE